MKYLNQGLHLNFSLAIENPTKLRFAVKLINLGSIGALRQARTEIALLRANNHPNVTESQLIVTT
jgi:hypothetical protein